ncbi:MAG: ABC transporter transmembrane domain-containing protein [Bacteroidota bacterium]
MSRRRREIADDSKKGKLNKESVSEAFEVFKYVLPYKWSFFIGLLLLVISSGVFLVFPDAAGEIANIANNKPTWELGFTLNEMILFLFALLIFQAITSFIRLYLFTRVSEMGMADLRKNLYQKLITLPIPFYDEHRVGDITSRITNDISQLQSIFSFTLAQFVRHLVIFVGGIGVILWKMPRLSLLMLATFPVIVIIAILFGRFIRKIAKLRQDELAKSNVVVDETLQSVNVVKAFTNEWTELFRYGKVIDRVVKVSMKLAIWRGLFVVFIIAVMFGAIFFILWRGALMVQSGVMEVGELFSFILYTMFIGGSIANFGGIYEQILTTLGATQRVREILRESSEPVNEAGAIGDGEKLKGEIAFRNINFAYPSRNDIDVLKNMSFEIEAGKKVALVGASGAGKSTIIHMLLQFYKPEEGQIFIDGKPVEDFSLTTYRQNIAFVPQEVMLFGGTIGENIGYGKPDASDEEILDAAEKANALEFINSFPEGLDTMVGERGVKLSGGQRQRIAIARAILRDPAILLLDEATSSLDAEGEKVVQEALNTLMQGRTSIIIAHRLATIRDVDRIFVIDKGEIIEQGNHQELFSMEDGAYSNLAKLQFELH